MRNVCLAARSYGAWDSGVVRISKRFPRLALTHWSKERSLESESKVRPPVSICHIDHFMDGLSKDEQVSSPTWSFPTKVFARVRGTLAAVLYFVCSIPLLLPKPWTLAAQIASKEKDKWMANDGLSFWKPSDNLLLLGIFSSVVRALIPGRNRFPSLCRRQRLDDKICG